MSVGPTRGPVQRPSDDRDFTEIFQRLDDLERALAAAGWRFNFDNEGGSGYVQFNDSTDVDLLPDPMAFGGSWGAAFEDDSGDGLAIGSTTNLTLGSRGLLILYALGLITIRLSAAQTLTVVDSGNNPIFRVDEDGDLHGKTGKALTFDL